MLSGDDYKVGPLLDVEDGTQLGENSRNESFKQIFSGVRRHLEIAAKKSCDRYNLRRRHVEYLPNQLVWKRNFVLSDASKYFSHKLAPKFVGPYFIHKRISPWTYELRDEHGNSKGVWHSKDLKPGPGEESDRGKVIGEKKAPMNMESHKELELESSVKEGEIPKGKAKEKRRTFGVKVIQPSAWDVLVKVSSHRMSLITSFQK
nr:unnamed protein product [Callosobruchus analis]